MQALASALARYGQAVGRLRSSATVRQGRRWRHCFRRFGDRVTFLGALDQDGVNEAVPAQRRIGVARRRRGLSAWSISKRRPQGCPVLAEDRPGVRDVVDGGGWLTPANDVSAYARAIESIISDADGRAPCRTPGAREGRVRPPHRQRPRDLDRSARPSDQERMPLISARIALMRHGHTAWNRAGRIQGRVDQPLDDAARTHLARAAVA